MRAEKTWSFELPNWAEHRLGGMKAGKRDEYNFVYNSFVLINTVMSHNDKLSC